MKYKKLTNEQILISIDRLTRFKYTKDKYVRVFSDIILSNLIEPKLKKTEILSMDFKDLTFYATEIFNNSLESISSNLYINNILKEYENKIFNNDKETQILLNNNIDYHSAIKKFSKDLPINLKWLKNISNYAEKKDLKTLRKELFLRYPIEKVVLVEGITEEILLPEFAKALGYNFDAEGIQLIPAGGKNQVVKLYYNLINILKIPIFILLDKDAESNILQLSPKLRNFDKIHLLSSGEFEDLLTKDIIITTLNKYFMNFSEVSGFEFNTNSSMVKNLEEIFKSKGFHEFKKAEFAKLIKENITNDIYISPEIKIIIREIKLLEKKLDTKICS